MTIQFDLSDKLRKIEGLIFGAGTPGERVAAEAAMTRLRARLAEAKRNDPPVEVEFVIPDAWSRQIFVALCRRYRLEPYRYARQQHGALTVRAPRRFLDDVLWRQFSSIDAELRAYLTEVTLKVVRDEICADTREVGEVLEALPAA